MCPQCDGVVTTFISKQESSVFLLFLTFSSEISYDVFNEWMCVFDVILLDVVASRLSLRVMPAPLYFSTRILLEPTITRGDFWHSFR